MKFLRHLTAVVLLVAVIVGLGMVWAHASGGGAGMSAEVRPDTGFHLSALNLADTGDLMRTCVIEAALAAVVITVSAIRRWHRRMRRTAARA